MSREMINAVAPAFLFACKVHVGQLCDEGHPYIIHPIQVAEIIEVSHPFDFNLICAAYLHDVIEDSDTTYEDLVREFGEDIAGLVNEVTHEGQKDNVGFYFPRLKTQRGICLKFADRLSNISRMGTWDEKRKEHYLKKSKFWRSSADESYNFI